MSEGAGIRIAVIGTTPAIRRFYRELRAFGVTREAANHMVFGAVEYTGEGWAAFAVEGVPVKDFVAKKLGSPVPESKTP